MRICQSQICAFLQKYLYRENTLDLFAFMRISCDMNFQTVIIEAEARLSATGITVDEFCERAGIHRATWQRWKAGTTEPQMRTWRRIEEALPPEPEAEPEKVAV